MPFDVPVFERLEIDLTLRVGGSRRARNGQEGRAVLRLRRRVHELVDRRVARERPRLVPRAAQAEAHEVVIEGDDALEVAGDATEVPHPVEVGGRGCHDGRRRRRLRGQQARARESAPPEQR